MPRRHLVAAGAATIQAIAHAFGVDKAIQLGGYQAFGRSLRCGADHGDGEGGEGGDKASGLYGVVSG